MFAGRQAKQIGRDQIKKGSNYGNPRNHSYKIPMHDERAALAMPTRHVWLCPAAGEPELCVVCSTKLASNFISSGGPRKNRRMRIGTKQQMPALKSLRLECFARLVAMMNPVDHAFTEAGFTPSLLAWHDGNALALCPAVAARIEELRAEFRERALAHAEYLQRRRFQQRQEKSDHA